MRKVLLGVALLLVTGPRPTLALDGSMGVGLTFTHKGVEPFAGMDGGHESGNGSVYDGAWISGPSSNRRSGSPGVSAKASGGASGGGLGISGNAGGGVGPGGGSPGLGAGHGKGR